MGKSLLVPTRFYSFGPFCLDISRLLLYSDGQTVQLAPRFIRALSVLVQNHGVDLTKEYLMDHLWPDTAVEENNLTVIISALRKTLGEGPEQHNYIVTIPGKGYRFVAEVVTTAEQPTKGIWSVSGENQEVLTLAKGSPSHALQKFKISRNHMIWLGVAILAMAMLGLWTSRWVTAKANTTHTLAVLPFESEGFGFDDGYLSQGIADILAGRLRNIRHISVRPIEDVFPYRNSRYDPREVGRNLGVSTLVTGTVRKSGEHGINVSIKLIRASDASVFWSEEFSGERLKGILDIQNRIADRIAYALTVNPQKEKKEDIAQRYTANPQAYQLYLQGQYFLMHRSRYSAQDDLFKAVEYFQQAIEKDQTFALAYASLANAYNKLSWYMPAEDSFANAEIAAQKALALDPNLAEAYRSLAVGKQVYEWDFTRADAAYRRSLELDPEDAITYRWYAEELLAMGRIQEAENEWHRAQQLDPFSTLYDTLGHIYFYSRRYREAFLELQGKQDIDPDAFWYVAWIYGFHKGELVGTAANHVLLPPSSVENGLTDCEATYAYAARGNKEDVQSCIKSLQKGAATPDITPYNIALLYVALKDNDSAFHWLERARQAHTWNLSYVKVDPRLDDLRADPRFNTLLQSMGLRQ